MVLEADDGRDRRFSCPVEGCGRRLVFRRSGGMVVLNRGDFFALHSGGTTMLSVNAGVGKP